MSSITQHVNFILTNGIVNIFALKYLIKKHKVTYDSNKEDAFVVRF